LAFLEREKPEKIPNLTRSWKKKQETSIIARKA
jgi:hypothetical protein